MKTLLFLFLLALSFGNSIAQNLKSCGYDELTQKIWTANPAIKEAQLNKIKQSAFAAKPSAVPAYTIPVVFHILHLGGSENISDAQILDAMYILNRDFRKQNADTISILPPFQAADVNFEFRLATKDTNGNCTTGIIRHYTPLAHWDILPQYYIYTWDPSKYLNIYIVKDIPTFNSTGAYAYAPGSTGPAEDAIVAIHGGVGSIGTGTQQHSRGLTHEVGHWFGVPHIWGNGNPGIACGDDGIGDTPVTKGFYTCPSTTVAICNAGVAENHQNYEDYSGCGMMFTAGQAAVMAAAINSTLAGRSNLWTNANLIATGVINPSSPCQLIAEAGSNNNSYTVCTGQAITFNDYSYNGTVTAWSWSASGGASVTNPNASSANIIFPSAGVKTVSLQVSNSNSSAVITKTVLVINTAAITSGNSESFEVIGLPVGFNVINSGGAPWAQSIVAAASGTKSYFVDGSQEPASDINILETTSYDFLNNPGASFSFKYAYARYNSSNTDVFKIQASDCGGEWTDIYQPNNISLASGSGGTSTTPFFPTSSQFKTYVISNHPAFSPFLNTASVKLRFYFKADSVAGHGNNFFLDDLNFDTPNGVKENDLSRSIFLKLYPNPSNGITTLDFVLSDKAIINYKITDVTGRIIEKQDLNLDAGHHNLNINQTKTPESGIYLVNLNINGAKISRKLIIE
ncbi:MAG: T9SS type A sorting domain-containing protein [Bacteroidia bacterium]|nr:T9SS type A sorting domain-containing protein [Bacteroidia bacterium]